MKIHLQLIFDKSIVFLTAINIAYVYHRMNVPYSVFVLKSKVYDVDDKNL